MMYYVYDVYIYDVYVYIKNELIKIKPKPSAISFSLRKGQTKLYAQRTSTSLIWQGRKERCSTAKTLLTGMGFPAPWRHI